MQPAPWLPAQRSSFVLERASQESNRASLDLFGGRSERGSTEGSESSKDSRVAVSMPDPGRLSHSLEQLQQAAQQAAPCLPGSDTRLCFVQCLLGSIHHNRCM